MVSRKKLMGNDELITPNYKGASPFIIPQEAKGKDLKRQKQLRCFYQAILSGNYQDKMSSNCQILCPRIRKD